MNDSLSSHAAEAQSGIVPRQEKDCYCLIAAHWHHEIRPNIETTDSLIINSCSGQFMYTAQHSSDVPCSANIGTKYAASRVRYRVARG